jgi:hypothetical protein
MSGFPEILTQIWALKKAAKNFNRQTSIKIYGKTATTSGSTASMSCSSMALRSFASSTIASCRASLAISD